MHITDISLLVQAVRSNTNVQFSVKFSVNINKIDFIFVPYKNTNVHNLMNIHLLWKQTQFKHK